MTEVDYSLERFPPEAQDWFDTDLLEGEALVDLQAENAADRVNQAIVSWIERKALTSFGIDDPFMSDHSYVGVTETEFGDDLCSQKYEVGFFH